MKTYDCDHVAAIEEAGIITVTDDLLAPLRRAYAMIILMRSATEDTEQTQ